MCTRVFVTRYSAYLEDQVPDAGRVELRSRSAPPPELDGGSDVSTPRFPGGRTVDV